MTKSAPREFAERIASYLFDDVSSEEVAAFLRTEVKGLRLVRDPSEKHLPAAPLRAALTYWQGLPQIGGIPNVVKVEPSQLGSALGYVMLIDIDEESDDFRYALYGTKIADISGFDLTGKSIWHSPVHPGLQLFVAACYLAALRLKHPIYTVHQGASAMTVGDWHRLILPLGRDGDIKRFMVCNVPIRDGEIL